MAHGPGGRGAPTRRESHPREPGGQLGNFGVSPNVRFPLPPVGLGCTRGNGITTGSCTHRRQKWGRSDFDGERPGLASSGWGCCLKPSLPSPPAPRMVLPWDSRPLGGRRDVPRVKAQCGVGGLGKGSMLRLRQHCSSSPEPSLSSVVFELPNALSAPVPAHRHGGNIVFQAAGPRKRSCPGAAPSHPGWLRTPALRDALCSQREQKCSGPRKTRGAIKRLANRGTFMANFNRPLRRDAGGSRAGYMALAAPAREQRMAASSGHCPGWHSAWSSSACQRDVDVSKHQ